MATERLTGPQKAALFLYLLGEDFASEIVKNLDEEEIQTLGASMSKILSISPKTVDSIFTEFQQSGLVRSRPFPLGAGRQQSVYQERLLEGPGRRKGRVPL